MDSKYILFYDFTFKKVTEKSRRNTGNTALRCSKCSLHVNNSRSSQKWGTQKEWDERNAYSPAMGRRRRLRFRRASICGGPRIHRDRTRPGQDGGTGTGDELLRHRRRSPPPRPPYRVLRPGSTATRTSGAGCSPGSAGRRKNITVSRETWTNTCRDAHTHTLNDNVVFKTACS